MRLIPVIILAMIAGCSTVQTVATRHIDEIIESKVLDRTDPVGYAERQNYKKVLLEAKDEIITSKEAQEKAEAKAEKNARLAGQARVFWIITFSLAILAIVAIFLAVRSAVIRAVFARSRDSP